MYNISGSIQVIKLKNDRLISGTRHKKRNASNFERLILWPSSKIACEKTTKDLLNQTILAHLFSEY